tara:strand:+ start:18 stop:671 length:654 start_codon:yes stop_codon:yes gene_type:complete
VEDKQTRRSKQQASKQQENSMAFAYHNELLAAMTAVKVAEEKGEDTTEILDEICLLAPKRMKAWKNDKKLIREEIDGMRDEIKKDEEMITMAYWKATILIAKIETHRKAGDTKSVAELMEMRKQEFIIVKMMKYRIALFKKAIVVHSHSHNETIAKARKHLIKFLSMRDDWSVAACKYGVDKFNAEGWGLLTLTTALGKWLSIASFVAEVARPIRDE